VSGASVSRGGHNQVVLSAPQAGTYRVHAVWRLP
jgi:hypothetical protein